MMHGGISVPRPGSHTLRLLSHLQVKAQIAQKLEMGDVLHYIDFHQLQIENKQFQAKIEERNNELLELKQTTGSTVQVLNSKKKALTDLLTESEWLKREIRSRSELLGKIKKDNQQVSDGISRTRGSVSRAVSAKQTDDDAAGTPSVLAYVSQKATVYELQAAVKNMERKVEIAEMGYRRAVAEVSGA
jgi:hypothetical protein